MQLQHDAQGFLTGEVITDIRRTNTLLTSIANDVMAIKQAVFNTDNISRLSRASGPNPNGRSSRSRSTGNSGTAEPRRRERRSMAARSEGGANGGSLLDDLGRLISQAASDSTVLPNAQGDTAPIPNDAPIAPLPAADQVAPRLVSGGASAEPRRRRRPAEADARLAQRDARGRFTSNGDGDSGREDEKQRRWFGDLGDRLAEAVMSSASGVEEVDPTIKAFNEVAQPLARGYQLLSGGSDTESRWYKKLFGEIRLFRRDQSVFNRAQQRTLNEIDTNTEGASNGSGNQSFLGGLLGSITPFIMTALTSIGGMIVTALSGVGGILVTGATVLLGAIFSPIGLAVGAAAAVAWGAFTEDGRKFFANAADSFKVGWEETTGKIQTAWDEGVKVFNDLWEPIAKFFADKFGIVSDVAKTVVDKVSDAAGKANNFVKDKTGVDVKKFATTDVITPAIGYAKATGHKANAFVKDKTGIDVKESVQSAGGAVKAAYQSAKAIARKNIIDPAAHALSEAKDWVLGKTSRLFESGQGGAGTVSSGKGDFGGASYGTYQLSSKQGTLQEFLKTSGYGSQFEGMAPGTKAFNQRWKEIAQQDPSFGNAQHDFIKQTHYEPQVERLKKAGIDVSSRGKAVQDAIWSTAVQFGGNSSVIERALQGQDSAKLSDAEFVSAIQDYKIAHNDRLFSRSSRQVKAGTLNRALNEKTQLLTLASLEDRRTSLPQMPTQTVSSMSPASPAIPHAKPTAIAEAPPILMPLSSGPRKNLSISIDKGDVGQDISDRRLAHIITGGLST
jgi:hypothetical protein